MQLDGYFEKEGKHPALAAFILMLLVGGSYFIFQLIASQIVTFISLFNSTPDTSELLTGGSGSNSTALLLVIAMSQYLFFIFISSKIITKWHTGNLTEYIKLKLPNFVFIIAAVAGAIGIIPLIFFIADITSQIFPGLKVMEKFTTDLLIAKDKTELIILFFSISITPALCEEFIFRGYFQNTLSRQFKGIFPIVLSGIFFALFHLNPFNYVALSAVGIFLSFLYYISDSIIPGIIAHAVYNGILIGISNGLIPETWYVNSNGSMNLESFNFLLFLLIAIAILILNYRQNLKKNTNV